MNSNEPRTIWLLTKDGVPQGGAWALVKTYAEATPGKESFEAALGPDQLQADGWDATPTLWRRMPAMLYGGVSDALPVVPSIVGRDVLVGGLSYNLDQGGRPHPDHKAGDEREPLAPDTVVVDDAVLLDAVEALGGDIQFVERDTLKQFRVSVDPGSQRANHEDVLITRQGQAASRSNRP